MPERELTQSQPFEINKIASVYPKIMLIPSQSGTNKI